MNVVPPLSVGFGCNSMFFRNTMWLFSAALLLALGATQACALSPEEILIKAAPSLVAVHALDDQAASSSSASGVVIRPQQVMTSCSLVVGRSRLEVSADGRRLPATLLVVDEEKGLCLLAVADLTARPVERGSSHGLAMQESIWAVGLPEGTVAVEPGVVIQLRGGKPPLIETTLTGTPQTVGRGLFDQEGRCIGIATLFQEGGQTMHFSAPVEWLDSLQAGEDKGGINGKIHWLKRAALLEDASNWEQLRDLSRQWSASFPEDAVAWHTLGYACILLKDPQEALTAFQQTIRINPGDIDGWSNLGFVNIDLERFPESVHAYREVVRISPDDIEGWSNLSMAYEASGDHDQAMRAIEELRRLDATRAQEVLDHFQEH